MTLELLHWSQCRWHLCKSAVQIRTVGDLPDIDRDQRSGQPGNGPARAQTGCPRCTQAVMERLRQLAHSVLNFDETQSHHVIISRVSIDENACSQAGARGGRDSSDENGDFFLA